MPEIKLKRAYEPPAREDGMRILVDRLWPRGKSGASLELDSWAKAIAPSHTLRKVFDHMTERFDEFIAAYEAELDNNPASADFIEMARQTLRSRDLTLVFGARDKQHNQAQVLKAWLERKLKTE